MPQADQSKTTPRASLSSRLTDFIIATQRVHPAYSIAIVAAFSVGVFVILSVFRSAVTSLGRWGYLAAFAINALSASSVFFKMTSTVEPSR